MLLESTPLLGSAVYQNVVEDVIAAYWGDYQDHSDEFVPAYLSNDILRLWRTFCVNYEARTERQPEAKKIKRKIKNYTLKFSRMLTCYSALLYLLAAFDLEGTVSPASAKAMVTLTPTARLEWLLGRSEFVDAHQSLRDLLDQYEQFLSTKSDREKLHAAFSDGPSAHELMAKAYAFGDTMFIAVSKIGKESKLHRLLVV